MAEARKTMKVQTGRVQRGDQHNELLPLVDICETQDSTTLLVVELPGADEDAIDVRVEKGVLTIAAGADLDEFDQAYSRTYTGFVGGEYFRAFALSDEVDREKIEATYIDGVLVLTLPRARAAETHKIAIKSR